MRQKRYPLLLDPEYPPEAMILGVINALPEGERAGFMRSCIVMGHKEFVKEEEKKKAAIMERGSDG